MHNDMKKYINLLLEHNFRVFTSNKVSNYIIIEKFENLGYCEFKEISGFNFSTMHKPMKEYGTGFSIYKEVVNPTIQHAKDTCYTFFPDWAEKRYISYIKKYHGFLDYANNPIHRCIQYQEITKIFDLN